jgi:hypothetical protein
VSKQFGASATSALLRAERRGLDVSAASAGAGAAGGTGVAATGSVPLRPAGHCAALVGRRSAEGGLKAGHSSGGVRELAVLDNEELLELELESDGGAASSNGGGIATPSESAQSETSLSSGVSSASPGSTGRPKRSGMAL